ncbi:hypothetical protein PMAYCL1PPCAC_09986, partial [Pristionchus mayeri]
IRMSKFVSFFIFAMMVCAFAAPVDPVEETDDLDLSKPAVFIEKHLASEPETVKADAIEGIRNFQNYNLDGFKAHFDKWPAQVQKLFKEE